MEDIMNLRYALDTFYFLVMGAFVMWMAAGFAMLEAGLVRAKNTTEILTKNVALYSIACTMYMLVGYNIMYPAEVFNSVLPGLSLLLVAITRPRQCCPSKARPGTMVPTIQVGLIFSFRWFL